MSIVSPRQVRLSEPQVITHGPFILLVVCLQQKTLETGNGSGEGASENGYGRGQEKDGETRW